jgi:tetratricopeptide (TPR) repeat protein
MRPDDGFIVDSLGWLYYRTGRLNEAVRMLERAVELEPEDPVINDHLGDAYWVVGRRAEARFQWERALRMLEDDPELEQAIHAKLADGLTDPGFVVAPGEPLPYEVTPIGAERNAVPDTAGEPL